MMKLSENRKAEIKEELNRAYLHFGIVDEKDREERIRDNVKTLTRGDASLIKIENKEICGILLYIAISHGNDKGIKIERDDRKCLSQKTMFVILFVNETEMKYLIENTDSYFYLDDGDSEFENIIYENVLLSELDDTFKTII